MVSNLGPESSISASIVACEVKGKGARSKVEGIDRWSSKVAIGGSQQSLEGAYINNTTTNFFPKINLKLDGLNRLNFVHIFGHFQKMSSTSHAVCLH